MSQTNPSVYRLQVHLPYQNTIIFQQNTNLHNLINDEQNEKSLLTEYFKMNNNDPEAKNYLYRKFPQYYIWNKTTKKQELAATLEYTNQEGIT
ncbi:8170_t:CDS:2 [Dentiscutata erythropus]|uniref:8170_t:CDS:1 n=1 Tax=Dentiscutata erythropus TaxID=1348616 RepID=A0A9N9BJC3_9GLOM|nr:8170_t:CDS:2 [Dentiscutata erythropus]